MCLFNIYKPFFQEQKSKHNYQRRVTFYRDLKQNAKNNCEKFQIRPLTDEGKEEKTVMCKKK